MRCPRSSAEPGAESAVLFHLGFGLHLLQRHCQLCPELHLLHLDLLPAGRRWQSRGVSGGGVPRTLSVGAQRGGDPLPHFPLPLSLPTQSQPEMEYPALEALEIQPAQPGSGPSPGLPQPHAGPRAKGDKPPVKEPRGKGKAHPPEPPQQEHDFLGCMSKRSGLPRWILAACLFLSIMVMLWLSCASLVTAPEQHVKTQPLSINGDKEYLEDLDGPGTFPLPPVITVTLCPAHGGEDAGPLPLKVDLDKTIL
uniref:Transmembrane protein 59 like n=1 Tax=Cyanistes caeruleus TaxID=156563 RepID=A0A8C0Z9T1_CYACU